MSILNFPDFVERDFGSSAYDRAREVIEEYSDDIEAAAAKADIDWQATKKRIDIACPHNTSFKGADVKSLSSESHGRVFINIYHNQFDFRMRNTGEVIQVVFPVVHFGNHRISVDSSTWNSISLLWDAYNDYVAAAKTGRHIHKRKQAASVTSVNSNPEPSLSNEELAHEAVKKDYKWLKKLGLATTPGPYFIYKGALDLHRQIPLYAGYTSKGVVGAFFGVTLVDEFGRFRGMQRYYITETQPPKAKKIYRRHLNPTGAMRPMGDIKKHEDGDMIYIVEQVAGASLINRLTDFMSVAALYADNIVTIGKALRARFPSSPLVLVRDDDRKETGNKGQLVGDDFLKSIPGPVIVLCPPFSESDIQNKASDLSDFWLQHGDNETRKILVEI